jgi:hypothetical protein
LPKMDQNSADVRDYPLFADAVHRPVAQKGV